MSIYVTGDTHGKAVERLQNESFSRGEKLTKDDYVIILGDFGEIWDVTKRTEQRLNELNNKDYTVCFIDGNHENFDVLNEYPVEMWHGGKVHKIKSSVIHLMRGQVYEIDGKTCFTFGGARSHDIEDGILDGNNPHWIEQAEELKAVGKNMFRVNHLSWWKEEMPSTTEYMEGIVNLAKANNKVDFMFTHCAPSSVLSYPSDEETAYFNGIMQQTSYKWWGCGHYHYERFFPLEKVEILYNSIRQIA